jgi:ketosteroid isomerase-like protein
MSEENVEIVRRLNEAWSRGDYPTALDAIDPEIELEVAGPVDFAGTYRGHAGLEEMMRNFWGEFEDIHLEIKEAMSAGDDVVLNVRFSGRGKRSGVDVASSLWHVWSLREGKAVRWRIFPTKQEALEAAGLSE